MNPLAFGNLAKLTMVAALIGVSGFISQQVNAPPAEGIEAKRAELVQAGLAQIGVTVTYDPAYVKLDYPGGDVPSDRGVCTDVIIRAMRQVGVDLQVLVHEDKKKAPAAYPHDGTNALLDANIDHRRVPNLMTYFRRQGKSLPLSTAETDYLPGDIVVWRLPSGLLHIGLVTDRMVSGTHRPMMVHNIGQGAQCEDTLFAFTMIGHYRWFM